MKEWLRRFATSPWVARAWAPLMRGRLSIFTLHRFAVPDLGIAGHDTRLLAQTLEGLRRERYELLSLREALVALAGGRELRARSIVFTVDDGYADVALAGAEVFAAYDCPLTVFLVTGFVDGSLWLWWDQLEYACLATDRSGTAVQVGDATLSLAWDSRASRQREVRRLCEWCKTLPADPRGEVVAQVASRLEVPLPVAPPPQCAPLSWDDVRRLESRGLDFAPHTVTHPILSQLGDGDAEREVRDSWEVVRRRVSRPLQALAYPNGTPRDFGVRELDTLARYGFTGAVTTSAQYATRSAGGEWTAARYRLPRFPYPDDTVGVRLVGSGFRRVADWLRRA